MPSKKFTKSAKSPKSNDKKTKWEISTKSTDESQAEESDPDNLRIEGIPQTKCENIHLIVCRQASEFLGEEIGASDIDSSGETQCRETQNNHCMVHNLHCKEEDFQEQN